MNSFKVDIMVVGQLILSIEAPDLSGAIAYAKNWLADPPDNLPRVMSAADELSSFAGGSDPFAIIQQLDSMGRWMGVGIVQDDEFQPVAIEPTDDMDEDGLYEAMKQRVASRKLREQKPSNEIRQPQEPINETDGQKPNNQNCAEPTGPEKRPGIRDLRREKAEAIFLALDTTGSASSIEPQQRKRDLEVKRPLELNRKKTEEILHEQERLIGKAGSGRISEREKQLRKVEQLRQETEQEAIRIQQEEKRKEDKVRGLLELRQEQRLTPEDDAILSRYLGLEPNERCRKCDEEVWEFVALSPNNRSAKWKCVFCGASELVRQSPAVKPPSRTISKAARQEVWRRDEGKCVQCGSNESLEFDHIIPHSKGGSNTARNIQLLCERCNRAKSDKI